MSVYQVTVAHFLGDVAPAGWVTCTQSVRHDMDGCVRSDHTPLEIMLRVTQESRRVHRPTWPSRHVSVAQATTEERARFVRHVREGLPEAPIPADLTSAVHNA